VPLSLNEWESFYVITGSSAAALTGLMFVVVALAADRLQRRSSDGMGVFSTPTVGHFTIVLLLASIMTMPRHRVLSLELCLVGCAAVGLISSALAGVGMTKLEGYSAVAEDWIWNVILPFAAYAVLLVGALMLPASQEPALVVVAAMVLLLLLIGIHNAWDVAVYMVTVRIAEGAARDKTAAHPPVAPVPVAVPATTEREIPESVRRG
jgi:hypothetical protein